MSLLLLFPDLGVPSTAAAFKTVYLTYNSTQGWIAMFVQNQEVARFKSDGQLDLHSGVNANAF